LPAVELVNFTVNAGDIMIRTAPGGKLLAAIRGAVVAFEADDFDPATCSGWSVTAVGHARDVTDLPCFARITPGTLTGRRLSAAGTGPPALDRPALPLVP
jgi:uncharacterized protein